MIVGEYWNEQEEMQGKPFAGPTASVLHGILQQAGIDAADCYFTNVFNLRPRSNRYESLCGPKSEAIKNYRACSNGKFIHERYQPELDRLQEEIERTRPNVIIALGNLALWALCKKSGIKKYRGAPLLTHDGAYKVIPTWPPSSVLRQWELRMVTLSDIDKARRESTFPELRRPRRYIYLEPDLQDIEDFWHKRLKSEPFLSCDIETKSKTITEIGFSTADGRYAMVIPFWSRLATNGNYWATLSEERRAWKWVRYILENQKQIGQNFSYDMNYLWRTVGIPCPKFLGDTMILHHALQPEMEKGLGFLGSIYTNEPSWKFMRSDHDNFKKGDE
jgi:uracil-DNA glycosylase family 4